MKYNHYPPLPDGAVDMAERVIELADKGEWDATVRSRGLSERTDGGCQGVACCRGMALRKFHNG